MKKLVFACVSIILLAACSSKEQPLSQTQQDLPPCTINGHGCWEVVQKLAQTQITYPDGPETTNRKMKNFENPALQAWGITVTQYVMFKDGGSTIHTLNDDAVSIRTNRKIGSPREEMGAVTLTFKDGSQFKYNRSGKRMN
jgi:hypothetical protein